MKWKKISDSVTIKRLLSKRCVSDAANPETIYRNGQIFLYNEDGCF